MKTLIHSVCLTVLTAAFAPAAFADHPRHGGSHPGHPQRGEYARVIHVEPIIRRVEVRAPARECWEEEVSYAVPAGQRRDAAGSMIVGGIIGGVIGHQFGAGHGNDAATLVGTLIGASLAHDAAHRSARDSRYETVYEERCRVARRTHVEEHIDGYRVTYRYRGDVHTTRLPYDPGPQVRVNIDIH